MHRVRARCTILLHLCQWPFRFSLLTNAIPICTVMPGGKDSAIIGIQAISSTHL